MSRNSEGATMTAAQAVQMVDEKIDGKLVEFTKAVGMIGFPAVMVAVYYYSSIIPNEQQARDHNERLIKAHETLVQSYQELAQSHKITEGLLRDIRDDRRQGGK